MPQNDWQNRNGHNTKHRHPQPDINLHRKTSVYSVINEMFGWIITVHTRAHHQPNGNDFRSRVHFLQSRVNVSHSYKTFVTIRQSNQLGRTPTYVQSSSCIARQCRNLSTTIKDIKHSRMFCLACLLGILYRL